MMPSSYTGIALALLAATAYNAGLIQEKWPSGGCLPSTFAGCRA